jgi:hypothetical protein
MQNTEIPKESRWSAGVIVGVGVALAFYAATAWVSGPAYLADEIGYLNNAAFIAGRFVDGASSYHAGYSFILSPLFYFLDDPYHVWEGVLIFNAVMWGATVWLVLMTALRLFPQTSRTTLLAIAVVVACYPANVVMSGYAFSQSAVAFVFMLAVASMFRVKVNAPWSIVCHAALVGFLYWVHPTGLAAVAASLISIALSAAPGRHWRAILIHALVSVGLVLTYKYGIEPWRIAGMTHSEGGASLRYPSMGAVLSVLSQPNAWSKLIGLALGQLSYVAVATFGAAIIGIVAIARDALRHQWAAPSMRPVPELSVQVFIALAPLGCIAISALSSAAGNPNRLDYWVYGRYLDAFLLPLFAYGLLSERSRRLSILIAAFVCLVGVWLAYGLDTSGPVNRVNISGLWTEHFFRSGNMALWLALGGAGIVAAGFLPRYLAWAGVVAIYCIAINSQTDWHRAILKTHSNPSEVVDFVQGNFTEGCVYFDMGSLPAGTSPSSVSAERATLYSFFLYNHQYQKVASPPENWSEDDCKGVVLTYAADYARSDKNTFIVGIESQTALRVIAKEQPSRYRYPILRADREVESYWISRTTQGCLISGGCFYSSASQLSKMTQVGELGQHGLSTTGRDGFLFFGPYRTLPAGAYELRLQGKASSVQSAYIDVATDRGRTILMKQALKPLDGKELGAWRFSLQRDTSDVEIRLKVGVSDLLTVTGYSVVKVQDKDQP